MITREQVADLNRGDVVEFHASYWGEGAVVRGPLREDEDGCLYVGPMRVRSEIGAPPRGQDWVLTVVSRAPRPLYVNHPRTWPAVGDILRDCDGDAWLRGNGEWFCATAEEDGPCGPEYFTPLRLLWDGETGQVVP